MKKQKERSIGQKKCKKQKEKGQQKCIVYIAYFERKVLSYGVYSFIHTSRYRYSKEQAASSFNDAVKCSAECFRRHIPASLNCIKMDITGYQTTDTAHTHFTPTSVKLICSTWRELSSRRPLQDKESGFEGICRQFSLILIGILFWKKSYDLLHVTSHHFSW